MTATRIFTTLAIVFVLTVVLVSIYGWMVVNELEEERVTPSSVNELV